jgi:hypothetical protein
MEGLSLSDTKKKKKKKKKSTGKKKGAIPFNFFQVFMKEIPSFFLFFVFIF